LISHYGEDALHAYRRQPIREARLVHDLHHLLSLLPERDAAGDFGEVAKFELERRDLRDAHTAAARPRTPREVDGRRGETRRGVEHGEHAVAEVGRVAKVELVTSKVMRGEQSAEDADGRLTCKVRLWHY
jgi:hypothetical protein